MNHCESCSSPCEEAHWTTIGGSGDPEMDVPVPCCLCKAVDAARWGVMPDPDSDYCDECLARFSALQPTSGGL